jgi:hypothetical protein
MLIMKFEKNTDQANYNTACRLAQKIFSLIKMKGGIGVMTDQNTNVISYEFVIHLDKVHINFGSCLTSEELLAKTRLYKELLKDSAINPDRMFEACATKARNKPQFRAILQDLIIVNEFVKHQASTHLANTVNQTIH